jgi:hypothetical protein
VSNFLRPGEVAALEVVTPQEAARWIRTSHQRAIDLIKCRRMLDDIEGGLWDPQTHAERPVILNATKQVIADGHHRMVMILMHGEPVSVMVVRRG